MTFSIDKCRADGWRCLGPNSEELIVEARRVGCDSVLARSASLPKFGWKTKDLKTYMLNELRNVPPKSKVRRVNDKYSFLNSVGRWRTLSISRISDDDGKTWRLDTEALTRAARLDELRWVLNLPVIHWRDIEENINRRIKQIESEVSDGE